QFEKISTHAETFSLPCPFHKDDQLNHDLDASVDHLPGHPRIKISDRKGLYDFILREVWSEDLESISGRLWWMSKQDSSNTSPLHRQRVKGRWVIVTEDPRLHLVCIDTRISIKPLPKYIISYAFWDTIMSDPSEYGAAAKVRKAALGYLRTYFYLIQYESDLRIVSLAVSTSDKRYSSTLLFTACYWLSTLIGFVAGVSMLILVFLFIFKVIKEWRFAIAHRLWLRQNTQQRPKGHM
ncbi:hypothetical protein N7495_007761, partial [Penicillium taxi]|uniref:uncharacterized protein n=1 Tax=Penicillium taxi TaxID=168475 RepID=UPI002545B0B3